MQWGTGERDDFGGPQHWLSIYETFAWAEDRVCGDAEFAAKPFARAPIGHVDTIVVGL